MRSRSQRNIEIFVAQYVTKTDKGVVLMLKDASQLWTINPVTWRHHIPAGPLVRSALV